MRDLEERLTNFSYKIINLSKNIPKDRLGNIIANQIIRSGTSIAANYIEAKFASSRKDFKNFVRYSLKSSNENIYWLKLILENNMCENEEVKALLLENTEILKILISIVKKLDSKN